MYIMLGGQTGVGPRWTLGGWALIKYILCPTPTCPPDFIHLRIVPSPSFGTFPLSHVIELVWMLFSLSIGMSVILPPLIPPSPSPISLPPISPPPISPPPISPPPSFCRRFTTMWCSCNQWRRSFSSYWPLRSIPLRTPL